MSDILFYSRDEKYGWLSNFWRVRQVVFGEEYPTNEHYYQSMKARDPKVADWIRLAPTPFLAMKAGRALRPHEMILEWKVVKFKAMKEGLFAKFTQNDDLAKKLIMTGDARLHEDSPSDLIWGIKGKDMLGKLLMEIREEIKKVAENETTIGKRSRNW